MCQSYIVFEIQRVLTPSISTSEVRMLAMLSIIRPNQFFACLNESQFCNCFRRAVEQKSRDED